MTSGGGGGNQPAECSIYYYLDGVNGERKTLKVKEGEMFSIPDIPQKSGYELSGFFDQEVGGTKFANARGESLLPFSENADLVLYARWEAKEYDIVIYDAQEVNKELASISVKYGSKIETFPIINDKIGYSFVGVYEKADKTSTCYSTRNDWLRSKKTFTFSEFNVSADGKVILYAYFEPGTFYTVDFYDDNDILLARKSLPYGSKINSDSNNANTPNLTDFNTDYRCLIGWSVEKDSTQPMEMEIDSDMNFYGVWRYTIKFDLSDGEEIKNGNSSAQALLNSKIDLPTLFEKNGYTFAGWKIDSTLLDNYMPKFGGKATPVWVPKEYMLTIFDSRNTDLELLRLTATYDSAMPRIPEMDTESGFRFQGLYTAPTKKNGVCYYAKNQWNDQVKSLNFSKYTLDENGNIKLYAIYIRLFNVNYNLNGGSNSIYNPEVIQEDEVLYLNDATKTGCYFMGWYNDNEHTGSRITSISVKNAQDISLYAYFESSSLFSLEKHIRERSVKIYNRNNYIKDIVNFTLDIPYETLIKAGYTKVNIVALVEISEIPKRNDVVNRVELYSPSEESLRYFETIHRGDWGYHRFEVSNVDLSKLHISGNNYQVKIGYACFDKNYQDWNLGNVIVQITLSK